MNDSNDAEAKTRIVPAWATRSMTRRGKPERKRRPSAPGVAPAPRKRSVCTAHHGCDGRHGGAFLERACVVCGKATLDLQPVAAWDVPACRDHDLARDYRVAVKLGFGKQPTFEVKRLIEIVKP